MAGIPIPQVKIHKHLGVIFNDTLTWSNHIDKVYERCAHRVGILRRLRRTFPSCALRRIYVGAVLPIMEYACPLWSGGPLAKLIHLHEWFCRRTQTSLPPLQKRFDFHTLVLFYKMRKNLTPSYLSSRMPSPSSTSGYQFRREPYPVPAVSKISSLASFIPCSIILWNTLPSSVQSAKTVSQFKCLLKLILKTIGNRKGDCAWSCSRWQTQPEKICKSQRTNQCHSLRTLYWFVRCDLQIFSGCVCHLEQLHAQSPFLFPIVFSINLIPFFDICSVDHLLFFHPGCSGMCCFTWAAARSQQYTLLFVVLAADILWFAAGCHVRDASAGWSWMDHARPSSNVMHGECEDARRACANTLLYFSCLKHVNEIVLGKSRQAHQRKQSFRWLTSEQSCTRTLDRLWTRRRVRSTRNGTG